MRATSCPNSRENDEERRVPAIRNLLSLRLGKISTDSDVLKEYESRAYTRPGETMIRGAIDDGGYLKLGRKRRKSNWACEFHNREKLNDTAGVRGGGIQKR